MPRTIKFRAWDKEKKEWIGRTGTTFTSENPKEGVVALSLGGHLRVFSASLMRGDKEEDDLISVGHSEYESVYPCHTEPSYKRQYVLCQYTGLEDKNGNEIYEGDIVKDTSSRKDMGKGRNVWEIVWRTNEYLVKRLPRPNKKDGDWMSADDGYIYYGPGIFKEFEIIGNILEDTELLKSGK